MRWLVVLAIAACSSSATKPDECDRFVERSAPAYASLPHLGGKPLTAELKQQLVAQCRAGIADGKRDPALDCVLGAKDDLAVRACYQSTVEDYRTKAKRYEAKLKLDRIARAAKAAYVANNAFPKGSAPLTPATACCAQPGGICQANAADWAGAPWTALEFSIRETSMFQFSYESDGATFKATATGDPGCVGRPYSYILDGTAPDGNPQTRLHEPSPQAMKR